MHLGRSTKVLSVLANIYQRIDLTRTSVVLHADDLTEVRCWILDMVVAIIG